ncbi:MAG: class I SAM-dependent methyltransferase [Bacteroidota bacterium]|nr:class I SAM-dependent methyltransferase [Bacteroidota bacterium]MDX5427534.1 class I SAM-dependent methyltransferase [Bacteroidota bacterium]MDX5448699.1 class I SAM-dependent methyltransferase [Bacteroidota bacterium]MDX5505459.1 class I SAM-dependent methyltransferase [Bacteroidota bacterium]
MSLNIQIPQERSFISVKSNEGEELRKVIRENDFKDCLEIGLAFGQSACYMLDAGPKVSLTSLDPFQTDHYQDQALKNIEANGFGDRHSHIPMFSDRGLPYLLDQGRSFEFIFIDGDHKFDGAFVDFHFAAQLLRKGGILVFHDMWMRSLVLVAEFIRKNRPDFEEIQLEGGNMVGFRKIKEDQRDGMVFNEFYSTKGFLRYHINRMSYERKTFLGKAIFSLKKMLKR